jgi:S1-C subfamily serine protease
MVDGTSNNMLAELSASVADRIAAAAPMLAAIGARTGRTYSGILWQTDAVVTSEQALPDAQQYAITLNDGTERSARLAGRDRGTNVAVLRLDQPAAASVPIVGPEARVGAFVLALGAQPEVVARLALVQAVGPAWHSMAGGHIDRLIRLDMRSSRAEEGGPVIDASGGVHGMATAGPRGRALVIPHQTVARVLGPLLAEGRVPRGWLGVGLQPVAVPDNLQAAAGQDRGLMVVSLASGGPAEQAGIFQGDILLSLDGQSLHRPRSIRGLLDRVPIGTVVEVRLLRAGQPHSVGVTISARPGG